VRFNHPIRRRRTGTVLLATIFIISMLTGLVLVLCRSMSVEAIASANEAAAVQASSIARGAEQYVMALLSQGQDSVRQLPDSYFAPVQVGDGYFWLVRPDYGDPDLPLFGLVDESSKVNINTANSATLLRLPYMTEDVAAAIVDWRDTDTTPGTNGAENETYTNLPEPYQCKNAPFETVEELLLVRGISRKMLYGDGTAPPLGTSSAASRVLGGGSSVVNDQRISRGLSNLFTIYSTEPAPPTSTDTGGQGQGDQSGQQQQGKIDINQQNQRPQLTQLLTDTFSASRANEIIGAMGRNTFQDVFDFYFKTKLKADEFDQIVDSITANPPTAPGQPPTATQQPKKGLINVNTAPREVLLTLSADLTAQDIDKLLEARRTSSSSFSSSDSATGIAWVADALQEKAVTARLANLITGKSYQWSADIVAVSGNGRAFKRVRIVVDTTGVQNGLPPQIVYRRDLTDGGWPMDPQILASLRAGQGLGNWAGGMNTMGNTRSLR
jgi:type II secretory pathway component PulK